MKPKIQIFMWQGGSSYAGYHKELEFDMELKNNVGGVPDNPLKYIFQAISTNHITMPIMLNAVHLTQEGVEIYVSPPGD